ncbi:MAG: peroxide stress protein YaaA [Selenomonadales bacterium]|nr:peroxide stress protein YaaA [Selenomonadales bacterium]
MRIIISPAKKMRVETDDFCPQTEPLFLADAKLIHSRLCEMKYDELKALWQCSDKITREAQEMLGRADWGGVLTPAVLAYEGLQYKYMAPSIFEETELVYIAEHLRILSGLYGVLRPFDGVISYRLEMQAKLSVGGAKDLYGFWGDRLAQALCGETDTIIDLASKEYSRCIARYLPEHVRMITVVFGQRIGGRIVEKGTLCKMARGEMVRHLARSGASRAEDMRGFAEIGYRYSEADSDDNTYVFIQGGDRSC